METSYFVENFSCCVVDDKTVALIANAALQKLFCGWSSIHEPPSAFCTTAMIININNNIFVENLIF